MQGHTISGQITARQVQRHIASSSATPTRKVSSLNKKYLEVKKKSATSADDSESEE